MRSPVRTVLCFLLSSLLACLGARAHAACGLNKVAEMPLFKLGAHYAVMAQIEDTFRPIIVDTGAPTTLINLSVAEEFELKPDLSPGSATPVLGLGQTKAEVLPNAIPSILGFGDLVYHDRSTVVARSESANSPEEESIGLLGDDILSQFDVEFDFPAGKLTFYRAVDCHDTFLPWTGRYSAIPFLRDNTKIVIDVVLNGERNQAIVDTGNPNSFVSRSLLSRWGVSASTLSKPIGTIGSPFNGGNSFAVSLFTFDKVKIGYDFFPAMNMGVADIDFPSASINLGLDFFRSRKLWISYPNKWMFLAESGAAKLAYSVQPMARQAREVDAEPTATTRAIDAPRAAVGQEPAPGAARP